MPILADNTIRADDFINESEKDATPANDEGRVAKLEENAKISPEFLSDSEVDVTLGETIDGTTTPKAVFISDGSIDETTTNENSGSNTTAVAIDNTDMASQAFINTYFDYITEVQWDLTTTGVGVDDNVYVELFAVDGSNFPTGSALGSEVFNSNDLQTANGVCTFSSPIAVSRNTNYAVVMRAVSTAGDIYEFLRTTDNDPSFPIPVAFNSGGGWANSGNYANSFYVKGYQTLTSGKVYKSGTELEQRKKFSGFIYESGVTDDVLGMLNDIARDFSGLTSGSKYYITTDGDISTTPSDVMIGKAFNTSSIRLYKSRIMGAGSSIINSSGDEYTVLNAGFIYGYYEVVGGTASADFTAVIGGQTINGSGSDTYDTQYSFCFPVDYGDTFTATYSGSGSVVAYFRPLN